MLVCPFAWSPAGSQQSQRSHSLKHSWTQGCIPSLGQGQRMWTSHLNQSCKTTHSQECHADMDFVAVLSPGCTTRYLTAQQKQLQATCWGLEPS